MLTHKLLEKSCKYSYLEEDIEEGDGEQDHQEGGGRVRNDHNDAQHLVS